MILFRQIAASALVAVTGTTHAFADGWSSTYWPSTSPSGMAFCFLGHEAPNEVFGISALANGEFLLSIKSPEFQEKWDVEDVTFFFPSGRLAAAPPIPAPPGTLIVPIDEPSFHWFLDELAISGTLTITAGIGAVVLDVPVALDDKIIELRGPMPEERSRERPCIARLSEW